jgi:hypothetical protein
LLESKRTSILLSRLRKRNPAHFTWKINDRSTGGVADALYVGAKAHAWSEFKNCPPGVDPHRHLTALQRLTLKKLDDLGQLVYVVGLHPDGSQSMYLFGCEVPVRSGKDAFVAEMEAWC